jgi:pSer/pThr/pTyr-binding forkhead associated (FHA) protein
MPFCTSCGRQNPDDARFCAQCGTRLLSAQAPEGPGSGQQPLDESTATIQIGGVPDANSDTLPAGHALLVVQRGPGSGSRFLLDADVTNAGRHPDSEIFLDDVTVSRRHAEFTRSGDVFTVQDAGSLNGTYVNRDRIDRVQLKDGDEVQIGKYRLVFFSGHEGG